MVRLSVAAVSLAALTSVAIVNAQPIDVESGSQLESRASAEDIADLAERGAFGRLGMIFRPLISQSVRQATKTTIQGHSKANNVIRDVDEELLERSFGDEEIEDLLDREFSDEDLQELVERGAFGRLGRIFRPFFSGSVMQAGKTAVQGHAKANKVARRDLDLEIDELIERYFGEEDSDEWLGRSYGEDVLEEMD